MLVHSTTQRVVTTLKRELGKVKCHRIHHSLLVSESVFLVQEGVLRLGHVFKRPRHVSRLKIQAEMGHNDLENTYIQPRQIGTDHYRCKQRQILQRISISGSGSLNAAQWSHAG